MNNSKIIWRNFSLSQPKRFTCVHTVESWARARPSKHDGRTFHTISVHTIFHLCACYRHFHAQSFKFVRAVCVAGEKYVRENHIRSMKRLECGLRNAHTHVFCTVLAHCQPSIASRTIETAVGDHCSVHTCTISGGALLIGRCARSNVARTASAWERIRFLDYRRLSATSHATQSSFLIHKFNFLPPLYRVMSRWCTEVSIARTAIMWMNSGFRRAAIMCEIKHDEIELKINKSRHNPIGSNVDNGAQCTHTGRRRLFFCSLPRIIKFENCSIGL